MDFLNVTGISKKQAGTDVLSDFSLNQEAHQKLAIAGETGSGKSSLLKVIAGLMQPDEGQVFFLGERVLGPEEQLIPGHPGVKYLSQQFELPRFLTVAQVLEYANQLSDYEAAILYDVCRISHLMDRRTDALSGGEQQRIAIARLLVTSPKLLMLDEPYSNLDMIHKRLLKAVIHDIGERLKITCILISHDPLDLLSWADHIIVMRSGQLVQQGTPRDIYYGPKTEYVAALFGNYNLVNPLLFRGISETAGSVSKQKMFVRPEHFEVVKKREQGVEAEVIEVLFLGSAYEAEVMVGSESFIVRTPIPVKKGETVFISLIG
ncbi:ABC transporter ATP-binding protein [Segetibacter sp. 3557_3]|nr:ABC transporter ATP-binding protein [Segetibacter sp. 3557_3]